MSSKLPPFTLAQLQDMAQQHATPFHVYDGDHMIATARAMQEAFAWVPAGGYRNYYAVKALPNPHVLELLTGAGMGADCSSLAELLLCRAVGLSGAFVVLTSNNTPAEEYRLAASMEALINLDDAGHVPYLRAALGGHLPPRLSFRFNPGDALRGAGNTIIGKPLEAKFGMTREALEAAVCAAHAQVRPDCVLYGRPFISSLTD
jgi:diaminopimelate decarboxylase